MKNIPLVELYLIKNRLIREGMQEDSLMDDVLNTIYEKEQMILEDTSATGGPVSGGMGAVVSAQPSGLAGATIGTNWASGGGTVGSGDVSVPYNPSGANRVFQKIPMGKGHGAQTGKKSREKKLDMKALKDMFAKKQDHTKDGDRKPKVISFDDFVKSDITKVKKD